MANAVRGETAITLAGRRIVVSLSLRTLAELEDEFQADSFEEVLGKLFPRASARNMLRFVAAVLRGADVDPDEPAIRKAVDSMSPLEFASLARDLFERSGLADAVEDEEAGDGSGRPLAAPSGGGSGSKSA